MYQADDENAHFRFAPDQPANVFILLRFIARFIVRARFYNGGALLFFPFGFYRRNVSIHFFFPEHLNASGGAGL
jgi:hypothetical protein